MAAVGIAVLAGAAFAAVLALAAAATIAGTAHKPAQAALLPRLARNPAELAAANVLWGTIDNGAFLAGSLLAGALVGLVSLHTAFLLCAVPFLLSAVILLRMTADVRPEPLAGEVGHRAREDLLAGVRTVAADP